MNKKTIKQENLNDNNLVINKIKQSKKETIVKNEYRITTIIEILPSIIKCCIVEKVSTYYTVYNNKQEKIGYVEKISDTDIEITVIVPIHNFYIGQEIYIQDVQISVTFPLNTFNIVINTFGKLLMSNNEININSTEMITLPIKQSAPNIDQRKTLDEQLITGINVIDMMFPIGHGQRLGIIGDNKTYKTGTITQIIKTEHYNQSLLSNHEKTIIIYVGIGTKRSEFIRFVNNIFETTKVEIIFMISPCGSSLGERILCGDSAMSIADYYAQNGRQVCVFIDDLSEHGIALREHALLSHKLPGRESYPSNIFYEHASMLERALRYRDKGSVTCIPIVSCLDGNFSDYITTNIISITDGQIYNSKKNMEANLLPPVCTELSVSRTGSSVQTQIFKTVSNICKQTLTLYNKYANFYFLYKENCEKHITDKIKAGLFIRTFIYNEFNLHMHFINQIVCTVLILNLDKILKKLKIYQIEKKEHVIKLKDIIQKSTQEIISKSKITDNINVKHISDSTIAVIESIVIKILNSEMNIKANE